MSFRNPAIEGEGIVKNFETTAVAASCGLMVRSAASWQRLRCGNERYYQRADGWPGGPQLF
jgi:hypothetical protein